MLNIRSANLFLLGFHVCKMKPNIYKSMHKGFLNVIRIAPPLLI